jgi:hypothetical protein
MNAVYIVWHTNTINDDQEDVKTIGVYSSREEAEKAVARLSKARGFSEHVDGFEISEYILNKDHWTDGFVTVYV